MNICAFLSENIEVSFSYDIKRNWELQINMKPKECK